jgi:hypothetical protein
MAKKYGPMPDSGDNDADDPAAMNWIQATKASRKATQAPAMKQKAPKPGKMSGKMPLPKKMC